MSTTTIVFLPGFGGSKIYCDCDYEKNLKLYPNNKCVLGASLHPHFFQCQNTKTKILNTTLLGMSVYKNFLHRLGIHHQKKKQQQQQEQKQEQEKNLEIFSYDWSRKTPLETANLLVSFLKEKNFKNIILIGHSMGGLIIRIMIEYLKYSKNINQVFICGTPLYGSMDYIDYNFEYNLYLAIVKNDVSFVNTPFYFTNFDKKNFFDIYSDTVKYLMPSFTITGQCTMVEFSDELKNVHSQLAKFQFPATVQYIFYYNYSRLSHRMFTSLCNFQKQHPGNKIIFLKKIVRKYNDVLYTKESVLSDGLVTVPETTKTNFSATIYFDSTFTIHSLMMNNSNIIKIIKRYL